jgi:hypothetical protein
MSGRPDLRYTSRAMTFDADRAPVTDDATKAPIRSCRLCRELTELIVGYPGGGRGQDRRSVRTRISMLLPRARLSPDLDLAGLRARGGRGGAARLGGRGWREHR